VGGWPFFQRFWNARSSQPEYVHGAHRLGTGRRISGQRCGHRVSSISDVLPRNGLGSTGLFRAAAVNHNGWFLLGQVLELPRPPPDLCAIRALAESRSATSPPHRCRRPRARRDARSDFARRSFTRPPGERVSRRGRNPERRQRHDESMPRRIDAHEKSPGDKVTQHAQRQWHFVMETERVRQRNHARPIVKLVSELQRSPRPMQSLADKNRRLTLCPRWLPRQLSPSWLGLFSARNRVSRNAIGRRSRGPIIACLRAWDWPRPVHHGRCRRGAHAGVLVRNAEALETLAKWTLLVWTKPARSPRQAASCQRNVFPGTGLSGKSRRLAASVESPATSVARAIVRGRRRTSRSVVTRIRFLARPEVARKAGRERSRLDRRH